MSSEVQADPAAAPERASAVGMMMGISTQPQNAPKVKNIKKARPRVDIGLSLKKLLQECGEPAIGLEYITEYINPRNEKDHRMFTCKLEGCKSAWGTLDDIFNHVKRPNHLKNFFRKMNPDDARVAGMTSADILIKAAEWENTEYPDGERDYSVIVQVLISFFFIRNIVFHLKILYNRILYFIVTNCISFSGTCSSGSP